MSEPGAERVPSPDFQRASQELMLHIANGDFDTSHTAHLNKSPSGIAKRSFDALDAQQRKAQEDEQELYDAVHKKTLEGLGWPQEKITSEQLRHMHMRVWAMKESGRIQGIFKDITNRFQDNEEQKQRAHMQVVSALNKLHIVIDNGTDLENFADQLYKTTSNTTGGAGKFYETFCTGDMNTKLINALTEADMIAIKTFLIDTLGSTDAYNALVATKQTQDALSAKADLTQGAATVQPNEQHILRHFQKGEQLLGPVRDATQQSIEPQIKTESLSKQESTAIDQLRYDVLHSEAATNPQEHIKLMEEMVHVLQEEKNEGRGKLKSTIQETAQSPEGQKVIHDGYAVYIPSKPNERIITIGDIHGDLATIEQILTKEGFFEDMESGNPTLRLVFLGDLVDRGPKSIEVMTAVMQLKIRYKDRVHMIAADHDTTSPAVSSHDFPTKLQASFGSNASAIYQQYADVFGSMPKMVVTGNGVVMVHGGPPAEKLNLAQIGRLEDTDKSGVVSEQFSWSDPLQQSSQALEDAKVNLMQTLQYIASESIKVKPDITDDEYVTMQTQTGHQAFKLSDVKQGIQILQQLPVGVYPNPDRAQSGLSLDSLLAGLLQYDQRAFDAFLQQIGGTVMCRGHQTSNNVDGGQPNLYGDRLWTIHSTGTGSKESAYTGRETNPKYGVIATDQPISALSTQQIKSVW